MHVMSQWVYTCGSSVESVRFGSFKKRTPRARRGNGEQELTEVGGQDRLHHRARAGLRGLLDLLGRPRRIQVREGERFSLETREFVWALGSYCALHRKPFDPNLLLQQHPAPHSSDSLIHAARALGFRIQQRRRAPDALGSLAMPCLVVLKAAREDSRDPNELSTGDAAASSGSAGRLALLCQISSSEARLFHAGSNTPTQCLRAEFDSLYAGAVFMVAGAPPAVSDPDAVRARPREFGFRWFVPELLKHRRVWRDVLAGLARDSVARACNTALYAGGHRQGGRPPHRRVR